MSEASPGIVQHMSHHGWRGKLKVILYCLLPTVTIVCLAETIVRVGGFDKPLAGSIFFGNPGSEDAIHQSDAALFYSLKPNIRATWQGGTVTTNELGLRCPEIGPKQAHEYRILSLGESSTFGARVEDDQTYSAQLEMLLNVGHLQQQYKVINAGVSGYTSFQSLKYLETRGLSLQPDLVLFYHEQNDVLPTPYSDREIYESRSHGWHRSLAEFSAVYRVISNAVARHRIESLRREVETPALAAAGASDGFAQIDGGLDYPSERTRVSVAERLENLDRLVDLCRTNHVQLVVIHPTYADSTRHFCELTEFCEGKGVAMYEAYDALHPVGVGVHECFADECHPNQQGHEALAKGLYEFLTSAQCLPGEEQNSNDIGVE
ncbi:MAG TPA: hypothetical protein EYQ63_20465 [Fuerstia sp.]|nr:hypothetical protein [Fuerstiella sp.]